MTTWSLSLYFKFQEHSQCLKQTQRFPTFWKHFQLHVRLDHFIFAEVCGLHWNSCGYKLTIVLHLTALLFSFRKGQQGWYCNQKRHYHRFRADSTTNREFRADSNTKRTYSNRDRVDSIVLMRNPFDSNRNRVADGRFWASEGRLYLRIAIKVSI